MGFLDKLGFGGNREPDLSEEERAKKDEAEKRWRDLQAVLKFEPRQLVVHMPTGTAEEKAAKEAEQARFQKILDDHNARSRQQNEEFENMVQAHPETQPELDEYVIQRVEDTKKVIDRNT